MNCYFARALLFQALIDEACTRYNVNRDYFSLPPLALEHPLRFLPLTELGKLYHELTALDRSAVLELNYAIGLAPFGTFSSLISQTNDIATAIRHFNALYPLLKTGSQINAFVAGNILKWRYKSPFDDPFLAQQDAFSTLSSCTKLLRHFCGHDYTPMAVHFRGKPMESSSVAVKLFGESVHWQADEAQLWLSLKELKNFNLVSRPLEGVQDIPANKLLNFMQLPHKDDIAKVLFEHIRYLILIQNNSLGALAELVGVSPSKCQRLLQAEGLTYTDFSQFATCIEAISLMKNGFSVEQTAERLGFSSVTTFNRAFKRLYRFTPKQYLRLLDE